MSCIAAMIPTCRGEEGVESGMDGAGAVLVLHEDKLQLSEHSAMKIYTLALNMNNATVRRFVAKYDRLKFALARNAAKQQQQAWVSTTDSIEGNDDHDDAAQGDQAVELEEEDDDFVLHLNRDELSAPYSLRDVKL